MTNDSFKTIKLRDIAAISFGHPFRGKIPEKQGSGIRVVQIRNISVDCGIDWDNSIETEIIGKKRPDWLKKEDVLFISSGGSNRAAWVDKDVKKVVCSPHFYIVRVNDSALLPEFLAWQLNQKPIQHYFSRSAEGTLTKSIRRSVFADVDISVPPIAKQKLILSLDATLKQQQQAHRQLITNTHQLLNAIASANTSSY